MLSETGSVGSIDAETDGLVQRAIRVWRGDGGARKTVITIAHRLQTIADADQICVMSAGQVVEFGPPSTLLLREGGSYAAMARTAGLAGATAGPVVDESGPVGRMSLPTFLAPAGGAAGRAGTAGKESVV